MKRSLPIIIGALVVAALGVGVVLVLASQHDDEREILDTTRRWLVERETKGGHKEGEDFVIQKVVLLKRAEKSVIVTAALSRRGGAAFEPAYLELTRDREQWRIARDLHEAFGKFFQEVEQQRAQSIRLATVIMERFKVEVEVPGNMRYVWAIGDENAEVYAQVSKPWKAGVVEGMYIETFKYRDGEWVCDGQGRLMEKPH